jgi:transposase InsO family protein
VHECSQALNPRDAGPDPDPADECGLPVNIGQLCNCAGMTRQNYYKQRRLRERVAVDESLVLELIRRERFRQPMLGTRKLLGLIEADLKSAGVEMGRDRFFSLLSRHNLLVAPKRKSVCTTRSWHGFGVYPNLAKDLELTGVHQLWVSDITYIRTLEGFMFLSLVMDVYSRTIVGFNTSDSLEMEGALSALSMAQEQLPASAQTIHHSDRGSQYCCREYIARLKQRGMDISMTEKNHCYENAMAERLNGILKQEYGLGDTFATKQQVREAVKEAVGLYNYFRPHNSLGNRIPMSVHKASAA